MWSRAITLRVRELASGAASMNLSAGGRAPLTPPQRLIPTARYDNSDGEAARMVGVACEMQDFHSSLVGEAGSPVLGQSRRSTAARTRLLRKPRPQ